MLLSMVIAGTVMFTACNKTEIVPDSVKNNGEIGFRFNMDKQGSTKSTVPMVTANLTEFSVIAATNTDDNSVYLYPNGTKSEADMIVDAGNVSHENSADVAYWPGSTPVDFFAIYPRVSTLTDEAIATEFTASTADKGKLSPKMKLDITQDFATQQDIIVAKANGKTKADGQVQLDFNHILSQVVFKAQVMNNNLRVKLASLHIGNTPTKGTVTFNNDGTTDWTGLDATSLVASTMTSKIKAGIVMADTVVDVTTDTVGFLIPNTTTAWVVPSKVAETKGGYIKMAATFENVALGEGTAAEITSRDIYIPMAISFEAGKRYVFTLKFGSADSDNGGGGLDDEGNPVLEDYVIDYVVDVVEWVEATPEDIIM